MAPGQITQWLTRLHEGDETALEHLMPLLYDELRTMARLHLRNERCGHTLNPTALVHEAYLKLIQQQQIQAEHRTQFLAVASNTMRRILVDYARMKKRLKRGGDVQPLPLDEDDAAFLSDQEADEVLALDGALERLAAVNERASQVVQYRFYSGLTLDETAAVLDVSTKTVQRDWLTARAWLRKEVAADLQL
jgi:RNA polymerase sigma factor (TIGR02999 family)